VDYLFIKNPVINRLVHTVTFALFLPKPDADPYFSPTAILIHKFTSPTITTTLVSNRSRNHTSCVQRAFFPHTFFPDIPKTPLYQRKFPFFSLDFSPGFWYNWGGILGFKKAFLAGVISFFICSREGK